MAASNLSRKYYAADGNSFVESENGRCPGVEFVNKDGIQSRIIHTHKSKEDRATGEATLHYRLEIFYDDQWVFMRPFETNVNGSEYYYSDPKSPKFGQLEKDPFIIVPPEEEGNQPKKILNDGLVDETSFFFDNLFKNKNNLALGQDTFIYVAIEQLIENNIK